VEAIKEILLAILKILWKAFLILLWGACKIAESIFQEASKILKSGIDKL
jgi:hypothetical protein